MSTPNLLPRVRRLGDLRPFPFLTARLLETTRDPDEMRSELVAFIGPNDNARRAALMNEPRQRSWGSVVRGLCPTQGTGGTGFDSEGRAIRRHVLVRNGNLVPLGKEANRFEDARVLGLRAVGGRAKRYVGPGPVPGEREGGRKEAGGEPEDGVATGGPCTVGPGFPRRDVDKGQCLRLIMAESPISPELRKDLEQLARELEATARMGVPTLKEQPQAA